MNKAIKLILIVLLVLFVAACKKSPISPSSKGFVGGDSGLDISFIKDEPPDIVLDNNQDEFDIAVRLVNAGEEDIDEGEIIATLNGIEKDAFSLSSLSAKNIDPLAGKKKLADRVIDGEEGEILFSNLKYKDKLSADFPVDLRADVCYEYGTRGVADLCLKKEASKRRTNDICEINRESIDVDNSGATVKVTNFAQRSKGSDKVQITFDIEKKGGGDVFETGSFTDKCFLDNDKINRVDVELHFSGTNIPISCSALDDGSKGTVKLLSGKKTIRCDIATGNLQDVAFRKPLTIKLDYVYKDSASKTFTIESSE